MRFCKSCGSLAANDDDFCVICGAKIDEETGKKGATSPQYDGESTKVQESVDIQASEVGDSASQDSPLEEIPVQSVNPNLHEEYVDISSFSPMKSVKKAPNVRLAQRSARNSETKVVNSISDIESKTREVGSIKAEKAIASQNDAFDGITLDTKKHNGISKGIRAAVIIVAVAVLLTVGISVTALIIKNSGPTAEELYSSAQQKYSAEDYYGAIDDLSECLKLNTADVSAYMLLADAYIAADREEEAVTALESGFRETGSTTIKAKLDALSEKVRTDKIYNSLVSEGNGAVKNRDYNLAITKFTSAIEAKPDIAEPYILAADAYAAMKEYDKAIECLQNSLKTVNDEQISSKITEINAIIAKEREEEEKRLEEERKKAEQEKKEKEEKEREERERIEKLPVEFETKIDEKTVDHKELNIFKSDARWVEFNNEDRDLPGIDYANQLVQETLKCYYEFDKTLFGVKDEEELYNIVKSSRNVAAVSHCRVTVTYNKNGILSFVIYKYYAAPLSTNYQETVETHTIDLKTGDEYNLSDIITDSGNVMSLIKSQAIMNSVSVDDTMISNAQFFLASDRLVFYIKKKDWDYVEIPLPYSKTDKFVLQLEEDSDTTYLSLQ